MRQPSRHVLTWPEQDVSMAFRCILAGSFRMGGRGYWADEEPIHQVTLSEFWMGETPVTQAQFALWTKAEQIDHQNHFEGRPNHPAENMDWRQAVAYCDWLTTTKSSEFPAADFIARLPTEAQWEYACRAGTATEYYTGDGEEALVAAGWYSKNSNSTKPVADKQPNDFGLYDMHGNVREWCADTWDSGAYRKRADGVSDPLVFDDQSERRVLRGGSWIFRANWCRAAYRNSYQADIRFRLNGLRVCLVRPPAASRGAEEEQERGSEVDRRVLRRSGAREKFLQTRNEYNGRGGSFAMRD